jgi:hypothetical protein
MTVEASNIVYWRGLAGTQYKYFYYPLTQSLKAIAGNYIFAKIVNGQWFAVYVGETQDLSTRFDAHHAWECIQKNGVTHIHAHGSSDDAQVRRDEETDLRQYLKPPCNLQGT